VLRRRWVRKVAIVRRLTDARTRCGTEIFADNALVAALFVFTTTTVEPSPRICFLFDGKILLTL
jgi:hypothetical protein